MKIARVFNNNVVMALDEHGSEVILTGRGLGFQAKPGQRVNTELIVRTFTPTDAPASQLGELVADIAPEYLSLTDEAVSLVTDETHPPSSTIVAIADHISYAHKRVRAGILIDYPLRVEVAHLYPSELATAERIVRYVNKTLSPQLPAEEAMPIALHLVNANFASGDLSATHQMTTVLKQVLDVLQTALGRPLDTNSVHAARFVTHLRYFFVRMHSDAQFSDGSPGLAAVMRTDHPEAYEVALKLKAVLELRLGKPIRESELTYLTIHVARLSAP